MTKRGDTRWKGEIRSNKKARDRSSQHHPQETFVDIVYYRCLYKAPQQKSEEKEKET